MLSNEEYKLVKISNPISEDISCMRTSLAHSLLQNIAYNLSVGNKNLRIFECGRTYWAKSLPLEDLPEEKNWLSIAVCEKGYDFFDLKGVVEGLLSKTSAKYQIVRSTKKFLHPGVSADIVCGDKVIGSLGKIHPVVGRNYDVSVDIVYAEIDTEFLANLDEKKIVVAPISKYPIVERDIAVVVDETVAVGDVLHSIKSSCGKLYYDCSLFDIYRSEILGENKKSLAFNIKLSDLEKTLTDEEVNSVMNKVLKSLTYKHGAVLR